MPSVIVGQFGARMHYAVPRILHSAGLLERLFTDLATPAGIQRLQPIGDLVPLMSRLLSRHPQGIPAGRITQFPALGLSSALAARMVHSEAGRLRFWMAAGRRFCSAIVAEGFGQATAVYGFNSAALEMLQAARARGLFPIVEQTSAAKAVETRLLAEEAAAWPGWVFPAPGNAAGEFAARQAAGDFAAREAAEWAAAGLVLCGSEFAKASIAEAGGPVERCLVVPYGVDLPFPATPCAAPSRRVDRPFLATPLAARARGALNVLFCGAVSAQKGVPYLLDAACRLSPGRFRFRLVGRVAEPRAIRADLRHRCELTGSVPSPAMSDHYRWADVFLLPSICEGSATVCYEALAAGLPVVTTSHAGSVVRDGIDGYIVPIRDSSAMAEKLYLLASDPPLRAALAANATARSREFTLSRYSGRLLSALNLPSNLPW